MSEKTVAISCTEGKGDVMISLSEIALWVWQYPHDTEVAQVSHYCEDCELREFRIVCDKKRKEIIDAARVTGEIAIKVHVLPELPDANDFLPMGENEMYDGIIDLYLEDEFLAERQHFLEPLPV